MKRLLLQLMGPWIAFVAGRFFVAGFARIQWADSLLTLASLTCRVTIRLSLTLRVTINLAYASWLLFALLTLRVASLIDEAISYDESTYAHLFATGQFSDAARLAACRIVRDVPLAARRDIRGTYPSFAHIPASSTTAVA